MSVIYSFLSIESFVNYQLFRLWERRNDGTVEAARLLQGCFRHQLLLGCLGDSFIGDAD